MRLLKTLEEPPANVKFIFCTTDPQKVPETILSRCQRFDFGTIATDTIARRLTEIAAAEKVEVEPKAVQLVARRRRPRCATASRSSTSCWPSAERRSPPATCIVSWGRHRTTGWSNWD